MLGYLVKYFGSNNNVVDFKFNWILTALQFAINATRVVDYGQNPRY